jgi:cytidine deaminase
MSVYELIDFSSLTDWQRTMYEAARRCFEAQTPLWHRISPKRVACCIRLSGRNDFITAQNISVSAPTGPVCAERAAICAAVAKYSDLRPDEITDVFILGEKGPRLPCGVCSEWLYKINPEMNLYSVKNGEVLAIKINEYYGDETTIETR